jgi:preprotein translocase subunit SecG
MSTFKKWLLIIIVTIALLHTTGGGFADMFGGGTSLFSPSHGWNEGLIYMLLAIVVAIAVK